MSLDEMKEKAKAEIEAANPGCTNTKVTKVYENLLNGTLVTIEYRDAKGTTELSHVHFDEGVMRTYRYHSDVLNAVAAAKERNWFFRFLEFSGLGGLIALILVLIFSVLLCVILFSTTPANTTVVEVIKSSFAIILGYFFGSQAATKPATKR